MRALASFLLLPPPPFPSMALDINALWDYSQPDLSEQRFIAALDEASDDEKLILQTQIARSHGLRRLSRTHMSSRNWNASTAHWATSSVPGTTAARSTQRLSDP